jgi:hypothetical protein
MSQQKTSLIVSFCLLGGALVLLSGCTWENEPAAKEKPSQTLPLDKLKTESESAPQSAAQTPAPKPQTKPTQPQTMPAKQYPTAPAMSIDATKAYTATLETDTREVLRWHDFPPDYPGLYDPGW